MSFDEVEYKKQWYLRNKETLTEKNKEYRLRNKETLSIKRKEKYSKNKEEHKEQQLLYAINNSRNYIFYRARNNSKRKNLPFSISLDDIVIPTLCPYLNKELASPRDKLNPEYVPSLDRINSSFGYIKDNVRIISDKANRMKRNATEEELIAFAKGVLKLHAGIDVDKIIAESSKLQ